MLVLWALLSAAGGEVLEARLEASVGEAAAEVRLDYRLLTPEDTSVLSFTALEVGKSRIENLTAREGNSPLELLFERDGPMVRGAILLPPRERGERTITLRYRVAGNAIPLVVLDVSSLEARAGTFSARVEVPDGMRVEGSFPSNFVKSEDGAVVVELPIVPRFVSLRASPRAPFRVSALPGSFSGLFAAFGAVVVLYSLWMLWVERGERG